jgi:hypothetical protein
MVDNKVNSGGALYNMVFGKGNQKGGQLVNELKKLSKNK